MKIYTKKGDGGETSLIGGIRVKKSNIRIHAYGSIDELNSMIGLLRDSIDTQEIIDQLLEIQDRLFIIGSHLASAPGSKMKLPEISDADVLHLEEFMDKMNESLPELTSFILPGGHISVSYCHLARTICRRAERWTIEITESEKVDPVILEYLNRLSDYFFVLARRISKEKNAREIAWKPRID
jgi:cob(I)alamin adenosyltransferase